MPKYRKQKSNAASLYYYISAGSEFGPFTGSQLKQEAALGRLSPDCQVRRGDSDKLVSAISIKGMFGPTSNTERPPQKTIAENPKQKLVETEKALFFGIKIPTWVSSFIAAVVLAGIAAGILLLLFENGDLRLWSITFGGGLILYFVIASLVRVPGRLLQQRFVTLGVLHGKTLAEILAVVGAPNSSSATGDGLTLHQWMATGYHIALLFKDDVCLGVNHEVSV